MNNPEKAGEALSPEPEPSDSHGEGHSSGKPGRSLQTILNRLVLFCVGPLLVLAVFLGVIGLLDRQSDRDIAASNLAKNFQLAVDQHLQARISALQMLANSTLVDDSARWEDLYGEARGFLEGFGSHVILADLKMRMLINTRVPFGSVLPSLPPSKGKAAAPVALETGKPAVGDIVLGPIAKEPLVAIAVPSLRGGKVTHLLLTTFETRQFQERIDKVALPEGWSLSLLDGNNEPIARRGPEIPDKEKNDPTPILFSAPSTISSWTVVLEIPKIMHHRPLLDAIAGLAAMLFIALLLSLYGVQKVWTRLADAVASLHKVGPENAAPTVGHGTEIAEIEEVRRLIDDSRMRQEQAYAAMNESEDRYRSFFVHSIDAVLYTAPDGRILAANPEACTIFGRTEKEICALGRGGIVDTSDPRLPLALEERRRTGRFKGELNMLRRDGSSFPAEISTAVFPDRNGELKTSMIVRDATERRQAQERILLLNNRLQYLIEVLQQLSGAHTLEKIAIAVRTAARKLAVSDGATFIMRDGSFSHYVDEDAITPLWKGSRFPLERCISGWSMLHREPVIIEDVFLDDRIPKDLYRETFVQSLAIVPIDVDEPRGAIGVYWATRTRPNDDAMQLLETLANTTAIAMENIRSYRELEMRVQERTAELARANEHLQDLDRLKSLFIASMSHELRTPLNSILGFTGIILMGMSGGLNETQRLQLTMVRTSARHLLELINDVIDVSKIEAGKTDLDLETFDCTELAVDVRDSFSPAASEKGIDLQLETPDHVLITSDRRRVRQILVNLVGNAVKFTTEGGVQVTLDGLEGSIRVRVKDTGIGIRKEDMERLFQAFSRISIHGRPMVEGTGLGLYLSMKIATLLGGSISVESESGKGSSFTLTLPRQHPEASS